MFLHQLTIILTFVLTDRSVIIVSLAVVAGQTMSEIIDADIEYKINKKYMHVTAGGGKPRHYVFISSRFYIL